jgi:2-deoxy-scyllo-inosamine dehydrogenase (SAM-dependent)
MSNILSETTNIAFELSNTCQLSCHHKRCPLSLEMVSPFRVANPVHLPAGVVRETLQVLGNYSYSEEISFHQYNEPLIDPRLFEFVREAKIECPGSKIVILTNGLNLSEQLAIELKQAGVTNLYVTRYGSDKDRIAIKEYAQSTIAPIFGDENCNVLPWEQLDGRITLYDGKYANLSEKCYAPLVTITITRDADVGLCCYDWKRTVSFGNLKERTLEDILNSGKMQEAYESLKSGNRQIFDVCRRCQYAVVPFR